MVNRPLYALRSNITNQWIIGISYVFSLVYLLINLFHVGGDGFLFQLNTFIILPLALAAIVHAEFAHQYADGILDTPMVEAKVKEVDARFGSSVQEDVALYGAQPDKMA